MTWNGRRAGNNVKTAGMGAGQRIGIVATITRYRTILRSTGRLCAIKYPTSKSTMKMDLKELKTMIEQKATTSDLKGIMRLIGVLITILIVVVGGAMAWLKSDLGTVTTSIQRLNVRVTESMND